MDPMLDPLFSAGTADIPLHDSEESNESDRSSSSNRKAKKCKKSTNNSRSTSSSSKKKKSKEKKKHKKHHKKRSKYVSSSEESSGSEAESDEWIEKSSSTNKASVRTNNKVELIPEVNESINERIINGVKNTDSNDMQMLFGVIPTYSNDEKRKKREQKKRADRELSSIDQVGLHERELNPYWKDGGTGLPSDNVLLAKNAEPPTAAPVGDGGLGWLKKSYQRAKEQAKEEGKSIDEVAAERWGSLANFYKMLEEAEAKAQSLKHGRSKNQERGRESRDRYNHRTTFKKPGDSESDDDNRIQEYKHSAKSKKPSWMKGDERLKVKSTDQEENDHRHSPLRSISPISSSSKNANEIKDAEPNDNADQIDENEVQVLTDKEMNGLNAKIIKAELLSNTALAAELKKKLTEAQHVRDEYIKTGKTPGKDLSGPTRVITKLIPSAGGRPSKRDKPSETHKEGQRVRYFPDDDKYSLANMFQTEKMNTVEDENALFSRLAGKKIKPTEDYDLDDIFADKASSSKKLQKEQERDIRKVLDEEKQYKKTLDDCNWCFEGKMEKNIVVSIGEKSFLCVPPFQSLTEGHCIIAPMYHSVSSTAVDEDVWSEMQKFRQAIVKMFGAMGQDVVIFESALFLKKHPHMFIECVPMPKETGELAPIYFKKGIQECETEWSQNKKLVDLRGKDIRRGVPKGLPYFWVDFGLDSGFAHVIEDESCFPRNFAQEIIGGMLELDHHIWRKQRKDDFKTQKNKVMEFLKIWGPYDWTRDTDI